tara:strand:+ start:574 stop:870 length:297 start_codon:yes stop_codon:yes gene_type:complete
MLASEFFFDHHQDHQTGLWQRTSSWTRIAPRGRLGLLQLKKIRDMQEVIRRHMGSRSMSSITSKDMQDVLTQNFGSGWVDALATYQSAINAMDQGVRV